MARVRVTSEAGKGIEALRSESIHFTDTLAGAATYVGIIGPFPVDIDITSITVTPGTITTGSANTLDVFNGTIAGAVSLVTQFDPDTIANQVPTASALVTSQRVLAGTPVTIRYVATSSGATTPNTLTVRVDYDIPYWDQNAKVRTYGTYDGVL